MRNQEATVPLKVARIVRIYQSQERIKYPKASTASLYVSNIFIIVLRGKDRRGGNRGR